MQLPMHAVHERTCQPSTSPPPNPTPPPPPPPPPIKHRRRQNHTLAASFTHPHEVRSKWNTSGSLQIALTPPARFRRRRRHRHRRRRRRHQLSSDDELACALDAAVTKFAAVKSRPGTARSAAPASIPGQTDAAGGVIRVGSHNGRHGEIDPLAAAEEVKVDPLAAAEEPKNSPPAAATGAAMCAVQPPVPWSASLNFWVNGEAIAITNPSPSLTLLEWLRAHKGITGVHVGCGEGGCGICTVSLVQAGPSGDLVTVPINACLRRLCAVDGCHIVTTQGLGGKTAKTGFHAVRVCSRLHAPSHPVHTSRSRKKKKKKKCCP